MKKTLLALPIVVALASTAWAQGRKKDLLPGQGIDWQGDWDAAVKEATARNVPIIFNVHKDN